MSSEQPYPEQYTAWHLANVPRVGDRVTLTSIAQEGPDARPRRR
jgi:hypothetical protein